MAEKKISPQAALARIIKEYSVFNEIYGQPRREGVVGFFVPEYTKQILQDRLGYLKENMNSFEDRKMAEEVVHNLHDLGEVIGFGENVIKIEKGDNNIDLSEVRSSKGGNPYFVWGLPWPFSWHLEKLENIKEGEWMERETPEIDNSKENITIKGRGVTLYTKLPHAVQTHALSFHKSYLPEGTDTRLSFDCGFDPWEGFEYSISFHLKDGRIVKATDGPRETTAELALMKIQNELGVPPQLLRLYIDYSNLSALHKEQIQGVTDILHTYPEISTVRLLALQQSQNTLTSRLKNLLTPI